MRLKREEVEALCDFVDAKVREMGCDHSLRFTRDWAVGRGLDWGDLQDLLDEHGWFCDCEVVMNLPEGVDLETSEAKGGVKAENAWQLPSSFQCAPGDTFTKWIVCDAKLGRNTHAADGELLVPAPKGAKARKRVRKIVHFFVGSKTGMPSEVGVVAECPPISAEAFAKTVAEGGVEELKGFTFREAGYVLSRVAALPPGTAVGTSLMEITGVSGKREELRIHKVIIRRS